MLVQKLSLCLHILITSSYVVFIKVKLCQNSLLWREFSSAFIVSSSCAASFTSSSCSLASNSLIYWRKLEAPMLLLLTKTEVSRLLPSIYPHCAFSSNLFRRQITRKHIDQLSSQEGIEFSPWNVTSRQPGRHLVWRWFLLTNFSRAKFHPFRGNSVGWNVLESLASETNLKEKAQCDTFLAPTASLSLLTFVIRYIQHAVLLAPPWFLKRCNKENIFLSSFSLYFWLSLLHRIGDTFSPPLTILYLFLCLFVMHSVGNNYLPWI